MTEIITNNEPIYDISRQSESMYFLWLLSLVKADTNNTFLTSRLYNKSFTWKVDFDDNRAKDGLDLRDEFSYANNIILLQKTCSVLEMMIALSRRCEDYIMYDPDLGDQTSRWFYIMIQNLQLTKYMSNSIVDLKDILIASRDIDNKLDILLDRKYDYSGKGGLFPLKNPSKDQRTNEIWNQLNDYLKENFDFLA